MQRGTAHSESTTHGRGFPRRRSRREGQVFRRFKGARKGFCGDNVRGGEHVQKQNLRGDNVQQHRFGTENSGQTRRGGIVKELPSDVAKDERWLARRCLCRPLGAHTIRRSRGLARTGEAVRESSRARERLWPDEGLAEVGRSEVSWERGPPRREARPNLFQGAWRVCRRTSYAGGSARHVRERLPETTNMREALRRIASYLRSVYREGPLWWQSEGEAVSADNERTKLKLSVPTRYGRESPGQTLLVATRCG